MLAQSASTNRSRTVAIVGFLVIATLVLSHIAYLMVTENYSNLAAWLGFGMLAAVSLSVVRNWRLGVVLFFVWIALEDLLRKSLGNSMILYAVKDVLVAITYLSYLLHRSNDPRDRLKTPIKTFLALWFIWGVAEAFNPNITNVFMPILGLRMNFFYVPMLYLGYAFFQNERQLRNFLVLCVVLGAAVAAIGLMQVVLGPSFLNPASAPHLRFNLIRYSAEGQAVPQPNGPFADAGRFVLYVFAMFFTGAGLVAYLHASEKTVNRKWLFGSWLGLSLIFVATFESGTRMAVIGVVLGFAMLSCMKYWRMRKTKGHFPAGGVVVAMSIGVLIMAQWQPERIESAYKWYVETLMPTSEYNAVSERRAAMTSNVALALNAEPLAGHGLGTNALGLQYVVKEGESTGEVEAGYAWIIWELGIFGLILWLAWTVGLAIALAKTVWSLKVERFYWLGLCLSFFILFTLFPWFALANQVYQNYTTQSTVFFLSGLVLKLPKLAESQ